MSGVEVQVLLSLQFDRRVAGGATSETSGHFAKVFPRGFPDLHREQVEAADLDLCVRNCTGCSALSGVVGDGLGTVGGAESVFASASVVRCFRPVGGGQ